MRLILIFVCCSFADCFGQKINYTDEYVSKEFNVVRSGEHSPEKDRLLLVCYNKYFNQERFSEDFRNKNNLNTIKYKRNMVVEIFPGERNGLISNLKIEKIEENKANIRIHYSFECTPKGNNSSNNPFIIVETSKSRKPVIFFENGEQLKMPREKIYTNQG